MNTSFLQRVKQSLYYVKQDLLTIVRSPTPTWNATYTVDYDTYWHKRRDGIAAEHLPLTRWQRERFSYLQRWLTSDMRVLDVGCGDGGLLTVLKEEAGVEGIGIDVDPGSVAAVRERGFLAEQVDISEVDALKTLPQADVAVAFELLEHLPNTEQVLMALVEKTTQGVIFSVPNTGYFVYRLRLLLGKVPAQWVTHPAEHLRFWTRADMRLWLGSLGLTIREEVFYEGVPGLNRVFPSLFGKGMIYWVGR
jgi:methionine biosynthesis protein MetW